MFRHGCDARKTVVGLIAVLVSLAVIAVGNTSFGSTREFKSSASLDDVEGINLSCLSPKEAELARLLNEYRKRHGLPPLSGSRSLTRVARVHAMDLSENRPAVGKDSRGEDCNLHSWSARGFWTPVCYTGDHLYAEGMWSKPREITNYLYTGNGYENAYWTSDSEVTVYRVLESWKKSPSHNALILETGIWKGITWPAFGVGIYRNVAVIWFGDSVDPLGPMAACGTPP